METSDTSKISINLPTHLVRQLDLVAISSGETRTQVVARLLTGVFENIASPKSELAVVRDELSEIRAQISGWQPFGSTADENIKSGALPPKLALLLVEIASRLTQKDPSKLEATRAAYRKAYLK